MPERSEGQHSKTLPAKTLPDFSRSIQDAKKHVRSATRWCYSVLAFIVLILGGASAVLYFLGDSLDSWVKTGLSTSLSLLFASMVREFSLSLKRSRVVEDQIFSLGVYADCGDNAEAEKILKGLKDLERISSESQTKRPWLRKINPKDQNPSQDQNRVAS